MATKQRETINQKSKPSQKTVTRKFRVSEYDANKIQAWADIYNDGNFSEYIRWAAFNAPKKLRAPSKKGARKKLKE